jgi:hypothetical protein
MYCEEVQNDVKAKVALCGNATFSTALRNAQSVVVVSKERVLAGTDYFQCKQIFWQMWESSFKDETLSV